MFETDSIIISDKVRSLTLKIYDNYQEQESEDSLSSFLDKLDRYHEKPNEQISS